MKTQILKYQDLDNPLIQKLLKRKLNNGGLVIFPTETVYGIGGYACHKKAAESIYAVKGRPSDNPLIVHLACFSQIEQYAYIDNPAVYVLANAFWPGPMTLVLRKKDIVPFNVTGGLSTIAIRIPSHPVARKLLELTNLPLAAPSANISGKPSSTTFSHVMSDFEGKVDIIIDGGSVPIGLESTVIDMTKDIPSILRPGSITQKMIEQVLDSSVLDESDLKIGVPPKSPGMKYKHYSPMAEMTLITGESDTVISFLEDETLKTQGLVIIGPTEIVSHLNQSMVVDLGSLSDLDTIGKNLFASFRKLDELQIKKAYIIALSEEGLGKAIMNRVIKAVNYHVIHVK